MREDFELWWKNEGQYSELCGKELCIIAWSNGEYKTTYPTKTLTDEEIIEVHVNTLFIDGYLNKNLIDFARAILRKAQE